MRVKEDWQGNEKMTDEGAAEEIEDEGDEVTASERGDERDKEESLLPQGISSLHLQWITITISQSQAVHKRMDTINTDVVDY
ncbi:ubiquitin carboxyl-terminal hydrolase [Plakobranchus ocellatus]|uniref:Ubiquitin carboxyl-terminal hydrolase n=1 Tax=Plakobranchus ocellatus TaxID=259542 RepID=A0AAV4BT49_9GAST|nr:ubiquitin carboxyl-terminal hydrolase [Plakobranchus ocellatus]